MVAVRPVNGSGEKSLHGGTQLEVFSLSSTFVWLSASLLIRPASDQKELRKAAGALYYLVTVDSFEIIIFEAKILQRSI